MTETSARFLLPFILPGQAQKEVCHNEALMRIDAALHPYVAGGPLSEPPEAPEEGQCWLVGGTPQGAWANHAETLAAWTSGGWRFVSPTAGMAVWHLGSAHWLHWTGSAWDDALPASALKVGGVQVVGERQPAVSSPSGGTIIDVEARAAVDALIATLMSHGLIE